MPKMEAELPLCTATDRRCRRYVYELASPVTRLRRLPRSFRNSNVNGPQAPADSMATSTIYPRVSSIPVHILFTMTTEYTQKTVFVTAKLTGKRNSIYWGERERAEPPLVDSTDALSRYIYIYIYTAGTRYCACAALRANVAGWIWNRFSPAS